MSRWIGDRSGVANDRCCVGSNINRSGGRIYGDTPEADAQSVAKMLKTGAIGIDIEDGPLGGKRQLVSFDRHAARIKAVWNAAQTLGIRLFINAITGAFLLKFGSPDECVSEAANLAIAETAWVDDAHSTLT